MKKVPVSVVIANFNGEEYLEICLSSLLTTQYDNFEIIIVDDGSTDKSVEIINEFKKRDDRIKLLRNRRNVGAAASRNRAIQKSDGEIIVFLDNDTEVTKGWLVHLVNTISKDKKIKAAQSTLLDFEKRELIQMAGGKLIPHVGWVAPDYQWREYKKVKKDLGERPIIAISAALAVRKDVLEEIHGFDEKEAVYTEDIDLSWRLWIAGHQIRLSPESIVYHRTRDIEARRSMKANLRKIYFHLAKNSIRSILKNYEFKNLIKYVFSSTIINLGRGILFVFTRRDLSALAGSVQGLFWNLVLLPQTLQERRKVQVTRKKEDEYLFDRIMTNESLDKIYRKYFSN